MPSATAEELDWFNGFQLNTVTAANAARFLEVFADIDVRARLPFVTLDSDNHLLLGREPASAMFVAHIRQFLEPKVRLRV